MIAPSPYAWKLTQQQRPCPIACCATRLFFDELGEHIRSQHPEPPIPAEIIFLTHHHSEVAS